MKINKFQISKEKMDINLKFYFFLKYLVKAKLSDKQSLRLLEQLMLYKGSIENFLTGLTTFIYTFSGDSKKESLFNIIERIEDTTDVELLIFSLNLYQIKDLLLQEAKITQVRLIHDLNNLDPLSLDYDKLTLNRPYATRVNGALLALLFFAHLEEGQTNFMSEDSFTFVKELSAVAIKLKANGVEPNQIFMLMFSESINQSIISDSGSDYEDRILSVLTKLGIPEGAILKTHDKNDSSTEFDFFFDLNKRTYGIGAKRTLRERYKQFIKTAQMSEIDVMIEITLGLDLNEEKAKNIRKHGIYIFVADEVYKSRDFLKNLDGIYSVKDLTLKTLLSLR